MSHNPVSPNPIHAWLRGPEANIAPGLQPVAHALIQTLEEVTEFVEGFPDDKLWVRPFGLASVGFHLKHIPGVVDRLFTYARGEQLSDEQSTASRQESAEPATPTTLGELLSALTARLERALVELQSFDEAGLHEAIEIGRKKLPSTVQGALFHAAEHSQRHTGQLLVTTRAVTADS